MFKVLSLKKRINMPRDARVVCANVPYHVTQRGNYRQDIFEEEEDREKYMEFFMMNLEKILGTAPQFK